MSSSTDRDGMDKLRRLNEEHAAAVAGRFGAVAGVQPLSGGAWSLAFAVTLTEPGRTLVIRFGEFPGDYWKDRQAMSWASPVLPVPDVLEIGEAFDAHYAVSVFAPGVPIETLDHEGWQMLLPQLFVALRSLRGVAAPGERYGIWTHEDADAPYGTWAEALLAAMPAASDCFARCYAALRESIPGGGGGGGGGRQVAHCDLLHANVLWHEGRIAAVLDWGAFMVADALYDLAGLIFFIPWFPVLGGFDLVAMGREYLDVPDFDQRLRCALIHVGLKHLAYGGFRPSSHVPRIIDRLDEVVARF